MPARLVSILAVALAAIAVVVWALAKRDPPQLDEGEIKSALEKLPYRYRYRDVPHSGGALVVGTAYAGHSMTRFAVLSDGPEFDGVLFPHARTVEESGMGGGHGSPNDLFFRVASPPYSVRVANEMESALCAARNGHPCGI